MDQPLFEPDGVAYRPTPAAGSPWAPGFLHGGPPCGLLMHVAERRLGDRDLAVTRLTVDLYRPVPRGRLEVAVEDVRAGRRLHLQRLGLLADGTEVATATALALAPRSVQDVSGAGMPPAPPRGPEGLDTVRFEVPGAPDGFHTRVDVRPVPELPGAAWLRLPVPVVADHAPSPRVRTAALADFGNPLADVRAGGDLGFINADVTLHLQRPPLGEWLGFLTVGSGEPTGVGMGMTRLFDMDGIVGGVTQTLLANQPVPRTGHRRTGRADRTD